MDPAITTTTPFSNRPTTMSDANTAGVENAGGHNAKVTAQSFSGQGLDPSRVSTTSLRAPAYQTAFDYSQEVRVVHRENVANPAPLGLFAFGLTTALLQGANTALTEKSTSFFVYSFALFYGGLAQLLAGMWEFKRQNTFGATAFSSYGAFWMSYAIFGILVSAGVFTGAHDGEKMLLSLWGILTFILMVPTLELNFALFSLFLTLSILFFILTGGLASTTWTRIGGWWGLVVAGIAFYIAAADLINEEMQMTALPLGKWSVGRPIMRRLRRVFSKIPGLNICTRGAEREDRMAGFTFKGKKGASVTSSATPSRAESGVITSPPVYVDVYSGGGARQTGHPHLYTSGEIPATSFEGAAVHRAARQADVRSGFGPY